MKFRPVLTAGAIGSLIAGASLGPAYANTTAPPFMARISTSSEAAPKAETKEPKGRETSTVGEDQADSAVPSESETPDPTVEADSQESPEVEASGQPEVRVPDEPDGQTDEPPALEPVEIPSSASGDETPNDAPAASGQERATETVMPLAVDAPTDVVLPQVLAFAMETEDPPVQESTIESGISLMLEANTRMGAFPAEVEAAQPVPDETRSIPPAPREIDTLEIERESTPPEAESQVPPAPANQPPRTPEGEDFESADTPGDETLPEAGASSGGLVLGGVSLLAGGAVVLFLQRRGSELTPIRRNKRRH